MKNVNNHHCATLEKKMILTAIVHPFMKNDIDRHCASFLSKNANNLLMAVRGHV
jgi:hypothetical protein